jgi:hypothetical protein
VLDAGWHEDRRPESSSSNREGGGAFWVVLIRAFDWHHPVLAISARDFTELRRAIKVADDYATALRP